MNSTPQAAQQQPPHQITSFRQIAPWISFIALIFFVNYSCRALIGPLLVSIEAEYHIDHAAATALTLVQTLGLSTGMFVSGFMVSRISPKKQIVISIVGSGVVLIGISQSGSFELTRLLFACLGFVSGLYFTAGMASISYLTPPKYWATSISIHELAPAMSFIFIPLIVQSSLLFFDWTGAAGVMGVICIVAGVVFAVWGRGMNTPVPKTTLKGVGQLISEPGFWIFLWLFGLGVAGEFAIFSTLPLHLTSERGLSQEFSNSLMSGSRLLGPVAALLGGWLATRFGSPMVLKVCLFIQALALLAMQNSHFPLAMAGMVVQPLVVACMFTSIFGYFGAYFLLPAQPVVLALVAPLASLVGAGLFPALLGQIANSLGFGVGFVLMGVLCFISVFLPLHGKSRSSVAVLKQSHPNT